MPRPRYSAAQHTVRWLAGIVPLSLLSVLLVPVAAVRAARYLSRDGRRREILLGHLPATARPHRALPLRILFDRLRVELNWLSWACRDRFLHPRWQRRIAWHADHHLTDALASGRPVIIATLHFGPLTFLGRWMCARGWRIGALADQPSWIDPHTRRAPDGRRLAPRIFLPRHTRRLLRFLRRGGAVIVALDFPRGHAVPVPVDDRILCLATGALRLAAPTGALVIPCIARERWLWRAFVTFYPPVPAELIADPALHSSACRHIADRLVHAIRGAPLQCNDLLLEQLMPGPSARPVPGGP